MGQEADALREIYDDDFYNDYYAIAHEIEIIMQLYQEAEVAPVNSNIHCPICRSIIQRKNHININFVQTKD